MGEQDHQPYTGDKPSEWQEKEFVPPVEQSSPHPLEGDPVKAAQEFEEQRKKDLDAQREEHNRRTAGGDPKE